jgi:hydrogenase expression/formation protein HypD
MKYVDEFRDPRLCRELAERIRRRASRRWTIMEVCGGQTHSLLRHGIDEEIASAVELIHGPGCPVCVTAAEDVDAAIELSVRGGVILASFGDMLRVPGSAESLHEARGRGGDVRIVYSPLDAVRMARSNPDREVVFFAVGFETTAAATALAVRQAEAGGVENFSMLVSHVRVPPAMELLASAADCRVQGFLAAGHVCTVVGLREYEPFVRRFRLPVVAAGFEPVDLLTAVDHCVAQLESGRHDLENCYGRSVRWEGNVHARKIIDEVFEPVDARWRGVGLIPMGGLGLRLRYQKFDARRRFSPTTAPTPAAACECRAGDVLTGRLKPTECPFFGRECTPDRPRGAPMVSSEGACAAYYRYAAAR